jgi:hypothetical protein
MQEQFSLEVFITVPWGEGPEAIPEVLEDYPAFGEMSPEQMRKVRAPVRIRLDTAGGLHALADGPARAGGDAFVYHFDAGGKLHGWTRVPHLAPREAGNSPITDYAVAADENVYLLEQTPPRGTSPAQNWLAKLNRAGEIQWVRAGSSSNEHSDLRTLAGSITRLLVDGHSRLYLTAPNPLEALAEIDVTTGETAHVYGAGEVGSNVFMDEQGIVYYITYFPESRRRGLAIFKPAGGNLRTVVFGRDAYAWLTYPLGVDISSNVYAWKDESVARVSPEGRIEELATINGVALRPDGVAVSSRLVMRDSHSLTVEVEPRGPGPSSDTSAKRRALHLPEGLGARSETDWRLIHIDQHGRYYVFGGEAPGKAGLLLVYSHDGRLEQTTLTHTALLTLESRIENHRLWIVDALGRVYIPVTDSHGLKVLRLLPRSHGQRSARRASR